MTATDRLRARPPTLTGVATPLLLCSDPINSRRVDEHFGAEAEAVRTAGGTVALIDHDALLAGDADAAVRRVPPGYGPAWYRGWMIPTGRYHELAQTLTARGCGLLVSPDAYRRAHELPGWYQVFAEVTPHSVWAPTAPGVVPSAEDLAALVAPLGAGPAIVKDYVKSRKHDWDQACYLPDLADISAVHRSVSRFMQLQEDFLAGGIVVRAFEPFVTSGPDAGEARVWWLDGQPILITAHPDAPDRRPGPDLTRIRPLVAALGCRFITTDLARRTDGAWRVIEVGDGQVSDLPVTVDPAEIINPLLCTT